MDDAPHSSHFPALQIEELTQNMGWLRSLALGLVDDPNDADDLVQAAMSVAIASKSEIQNVRGFLAGSLRKLSWNKRRAERHHADRVSLRAQDSPREEPPAEHHLEAMDTMRVALEEISHLPPAQAQAISLRYVEDLDVPSIAERLGTRPNTVRSNLARGLETLRNRLDKRFGERSAWGLTLVPLAIPTPGPLPPLDLPMTSGAETALKTTAAGAQPAATLPAFSLLATGLTMKVVLATTLAPLLLLLGFLQLRPSEARPAHPSPRLIASSPSESAKIEISPKEELLITAREPREDARRIVLETPDDTVEQGTPALLGVELTLVDLSDQLPVAHFEVLITPLTGEDAVADKSLERVLMTDERGRLRVENLPASTTHVSLQSRLRTSTGLTPAFFPGTAAIDSCDQVLVYVGPTLPLALSGVSVAAGTPMTFELKGPGVSPFMPIRGDVSWGASPFVRLPAPISAPGMKGPWTLHIELADGFALGQGSTNQVSGTLEEPIPVELHGAGEVRFTGSADAAGPLESAPLPFVILEPAAEAAPRKVQLELADGALVGRSGALPAGDYSWSAPGLVDQAGAPIQGRIEVMVGEAIELELPSLGGPDLERSIVVDGSTVPDVDLGSWDVGLAQMGHQVLAQLKPLPAPDLGPGMWRISVGAVPQPGWVGALNVPHGLEGFEISPSNIMFTKDGTIDVITVSRKRAVVDVRLTLVDGKTGEVLKRADGAEAVHVDELTPRPLRKGIRDSLLAKSIPSDRSTYFLCRADGYRMEEVVFDPGNSKTELTVRMQAGWSSLVTVASLEGFETVAGIGVAVDGLHAGKTDEHGRLWIEGSGPPANVELELDGTDFALEMSPFEDRLLRSADPAGGYRFAIKRR